MSSLSETVFKNNVIYQKDNYTNMDTWLVHCLNNSCKSTNSNLSKRFHFICYQHMIRTIKDNCMKELELCESKVKIINHIGKEIDTEAIQSSIEDQDIELIFPICRMRCYNTVHTGSKKKTASCGGLSQYTLAACWEKDGNTSTNTRPSIDILID